MDIRRPQALSETAVGDVPGSGTYVWEIQANRIIWSSGLLELYGLTEPPSGDNAFAALVHPGDRVRVEAETSHYLETGDSYVHEFRIVRPDGSIRKVHDRGAIERDASGVAIRIRGINVDVTDFREDTGELAAARRTIVDLVERSPFGIFTVDADMTLVQVSQGARAFLGSVRPLVGSSFATTLARFLGERTAQRVLDRFRHTLDTGEPYHLPAALDGPDASPADLIDWRIERVILADGQFGVVCHFYDLSKQFEQEKALRESEERLKLAYSAAGMGAWDLNLANNISTWSPELYDLLGLERDLPACPDLLFDLVLPEDLPSLTRKYHEAIERRTYFEEVFRIRRPDGDVRYIAGRGQVVKGDTAGATRMIGVNFDVTDHALAERSVRESEERLRAVIDSNIAFIAMLDRDGCVTDANAPFLEMGGLQRSDVLDLPLWESPWWSGDTEAEQRLRSALDSVRRNAETHVRRGTKVMLEEALKIRGRGRRTILMGFFPSIDADGNLRQIILSGLDITQRKEAEEKLAASEKTLRQMVEHSPFGIFVVDADFRLVQASEGVREIFGSEDPPLGHDFAQIQRDLWPEPAASEIVRRFRNTLETGEPYHAASFTGQRFGTGAVVSYDWRIERMTFADGRPAVVCHFYDLSERQRQEERTGLLMQELNHRSKNMLTLIQSIARQTASGGKADFMHRFGERLQALAASQDLLVKHALNSVPLDELVRSQLAHFADVLDERVILDGPPVPLTAAAAQALALALHELATNAAKHGALSKGSGRVVIAWDVASEAEDGPWFLMSWQEQDGPQVIPSGRRGFGTTVMTDMVEMSLNGEVSLDHPESGLVWRLSCPAANVVDGGLPHEVIDVQDAGMAGRNHKRPHS